MVLHYACLVWLIGLISLPRDSLEGPPNRPISTNGPRSRSGSRHSGGKRRGGWDRIVRIYTLVPGERCDYSKNRGSPYKGLVRLPSRLAPL